MILYQLNQVLGNILSSVEFKFLNQTQNNASASVANISQLYCGIYNTKNKAENLSYDEKAVYKILEILIIKFLNILYKVKILLFIYSGLSIVGILILVIFLDNIKPENSKGLIFFLN